MTFKFSRIKFLPFVLFLTVLPAFASEGGGEGSELSSRMVSLVLQLAVIMIAARLGGFIFSNYLKQPSVLGEIISGMLIGPYALGSIQLPEIGPLFPHTGQIIPVSTELYGITVIASIILLFLAGLETDIKSFIRYSVKGTIIGIGGLIFSFAAGAAAPVITGWSQSFFSPLSLFLGTLSTATSVGITARILSRKQKLDSPEGVTIMSAAVIDDVLGIVLLAIIIAVLRTSGSIFSVSWYDIGAIAAKAIGFWIACTVLGVMFSKRIVKALKIVKSPEAIASLSFGLALLLAGLSELAGLAMIIGAYIVGLSLSGTDISHEMQYQLRGLYNFLVPVFFCTMGMLVDFSTVSSNLVNGIAFSILCIIGKIVGCGIPAFALRFNARGALRIGVGMMPRGEVVLIMAGLGLSMGIIGKDALAVCIIMIIITTILTPLFLNTLFEGGSGLKYEEKKNTDEERKSFELQFPSADIAEFVRLRIADAFRNEEFFVHLRMNIPNPTYLISKEDIFITLVQRKDKIVISVTPAHEDLARFLVLEEILVLQDLFESAKNMQSPDSLGTELLSGIFNQE
ncbi:MAG: cation:proton antiporter [Fibrobacterota bacterium]